jgi:hypothetical protein
MNTIVLFGAGGKVGLRLSANLQGSRYEVLGTCLTILREATDEAARRGVPAEAARDVIFKPDCRRVFGPDAIAESVDNLIQFGAGAKR